MRESQLCRSLAIPTIKTVVAALIGTKSRPDLAGAFYYGDFSDTIPSLAQSSARRDHFGQTALLPAFCCLLFTTPLSSGHRLDNNNAIEDLRPLRDVPVVFMPRAVQRKILCNRVVTLPRPRIWTIICR